MDETTTTDPEDYVILVMAILCAVGLTSVALVMASYAMLEDRVMRCYDREGVQMPGFVLMATNSNRDSSTTRLMDANLQYRAVVEYKYKLDHHAKDNDDYSECYATAVRKEVKAMGRDFEWAPEQTLRPFRLKADLSQVHVDLTDIEIAQDLKNSHPADPLQQLELFVVPHFPRSGIPRRQVERALQMTYRLPTYAFCLSIVVFALFLVYLSTIKISNFGATHSEKFCFALATMFGVTLVEALVVQLCLRSWMLRTIQDDYLGGEDGEGDPSLYTISTKGSIVGFYEYTYSRGTPRGRGPSGFENE